MIRQIIPFDFWDSTPIGRSIHLCLCHDELLSPQIILDGKVFHSQGNHLPIYFIGTLEYDDESQRLTYVIDGDSITNEINHHQSLTGEFLIPILCDSKYFTARNNWIQDAMKEIDLYCRSSEPIELHRFLYLSARISSLHSSSIDLSFDLLTIKNSFTLTPINPNCIQIVPTPLLKNLSSATRNSNYHNQPHFGYCSLDRMSNNRILLILENDPQVYALPLIGVWVSGIIDIKCAYVWTVCLRYCLNSTLKQRLRSGINSQQSFLLVCYSPTLFDQCIFYEVYSKPSSAIDYDLWTCSKQIPRSNFAPQFPYDFQFQRVYNQWNDHPPVEIHSETEIPTTLSSSNTNESLFGIPRIPLNQPITSSTSMTVAMIDNRWKEELIERMRDYELQIQSLTALVTQLLTAQQNSLSSPIRECTKRDVGIQTSPSSPYINDGSMICPIVHQSSSIPADFNSVDILKPIFQFLDNRQQETYNSPDTTVLLKTDDEEIDHQTNNKSYLINTIQQQQQQQQHVTSTSTTGISFISNGIQMQLINQQSSTTSVYP